MISLSYLFESKQKRNKKSKNKYTHKPSIGSTLAGVGVGIGVGAGAYALGKSLTEGVEDRSPIDPTLEEKLKNYLSKELLDLYNREWRDKEDKKLNSNEFKKELEFAAKVTQNTSGNVSYHFEFKKPLFTDHGAYVLTHNGKPIDGGIEG